MNHKTDLRMSETTIDIPLTCIDTHDDWRVMQRVVRHHLPDAELLQNDNNEAILRLKARIPAPPPVPPPAQAPHIDPDDINRLISEEGWHFIFQHGQYMLCPPITDKRTNMCTEWHAIKMRVPAYYKRPELSVPPK
jgi:hypothetical protein